MQCDLLKLKLTWEKFILKCLAFLQKKLEEALNIVENKINKVGKKIEKTKGALPLPEQIPFDVDRELNGLLSNAELQAQMKKVKKAYRNKRLKNYLPIVVYAVILPLSAWYVYNPKFRSIGNNIKFSIIISVLVIGYLVAIFWHEKIRLKLDIKLANASNELSRTVQNILRHDHFNVEYLGYVLTHRIQERKKLDSQSTKIISYFLSLSLIFGIIIKGMYTAIQKKSHIDPIVLDSIWIIITLIFIWIVVDLLYCVFDVFYYDYRILLEGIMKYKFEEKS
ncbi:hypothetical protein QQO16_05230 [Limosilactobacillus reuteri]|uniref:Uncharacterized protein n=1 Tax=Limosilactobacillus reuteri subsp. rodentium (strain DSM 17509 / CIP 109821 / 100-23) TaxID=349123 RepID=B3XP01_LIMR1|nr:hypothetical protein [Limosilactobacillus reuteri]EDX43537.1 hypothetical protein Lreu23DRAFT_5059 [Limosilactobacillus reuteri subsp. rodentium]MCC4475777.1 hypothetical protein [Limosilactobacillus reuteri]MDL2057459.1 hypothetical protein [Limosilactobacillus reuteri]